MKVREYFCKWKKRDKVIPGKKGPEKIHEDRSTPNMLGTRVKPLCFNLVFRKRGSRRWGWKLVSRADYAWSSSQSRPFGFYPKHPSEKLLKGFKQRTNTVKMLFYKKTQKPCNGVIDKLNRKTKSTIVNYPKMKLHISSNFNLIRHLDFIYKMKYIST